MWFVYRKEILTKDNLLKRNWQGSKTCCLCDHEESVQHLFVECPFAKIIWTIVHMAFNITLPTNISHLFSNWLNGISKAENVNIRVEVCAIIWIIWHVQNNLSLTNQIYHHFCRLSIWLPTGSICVLSSTGGAAPGNRYCVQPFSNGCERYI
jgi:hypothetical protein